MTTNAHAAQPSRRLRSDRRGEAALEFALVGSLLIVLLLGCVQIGLMMWTGSALQSVAAQTARCAAINSPACTNPAQYAVSLAGQWIGANAITTSDVHVAAGTSCYGTTGAFAVVTITSPIWFGTFIANFTGSGQTSLTATACFPTD